MNPCVPDEVVFDDTGVALKLGDSAARMTIAWVDIAAAEMNAMRLPDRVLRILALIHHNGEAFEVPEGSAGFLDLVTETWRRYNLGPDAQAAMTSLLPGAHFRVEIGR